MISRSVRPVSFATSAQVRRETTADLILVRSPSSILGELAVERLADDQIEHRVAEELHALVAVQARSAIDAWVSDSLRRCGFLNV